MFYVFFIPELRKLLCKCRWNSRQLSKKGKSSAEILDSLQSVCRALQIVFIKEKTFCCWCITTWRKYGRCEVGKSFMSRKMRKRNIAKLFIEFSPAHVRAFSCFIYKFMQRTKEAKKRRKVPSIAHKTWRKPIREPINQVREQRSLRIINFFRCFQYIQARRKALL